MNLGMTRLAQGHQVTGFVCSTLGYRENMMYFLSPDHSSFLEALLAKRVLLNIPVADPFPAPAILLMHISGALIPIVFPPFLFPMLIAIGAVRQVWATWEGAGFLWLPGHEITSFCGTDPGTRT